MSEILNLRIRAGSCGTGRYKFCLSILFCEEKPGNCVDAVDNNLGDVDVCCLREIMSIHRIQLVQCCCILLLRRIDVQATLCTYRLLDISECSLFLQ